MGSNKETRVGFRGAEGGNDFAGGLFIFFSDPAKYSLPNCISPDHAALFPTDIPTEVNKAWKITLSRTLTESRVVVFCNRVEVLNFVLSQTACKDGGAIWNSEYWNKGVEKIKFHNVDTASDFYRISTGEVMIYSRI